MFIGHYAVAFAARSVDEKPSLGTYFLAAQFLDLLWPTLLLLKVESVTLVDDPQSPIPLSFTVYPWSHSLLLAAGWGLLFSIVYYLIQKNRRAAIVLGLVVISHWFLDVLVHIPDLPLYPGVSPKVGFALWDYKMLTFLLEILLLAIGAWLYFKSAAGTTMRKYPFISLLLFLLVIHAANAFGSAPPNVKAVAWAGQLQWLIVLWGYWADSKPPTKRTIQKEPTRSFAAPG